MDKNNKLKFFSKSQTEKFKQDIKRLESKRTIVKRSLEFATPFLIYKEDYPAFIHCNKFLENIGRINHDDFPMWLKRNLFIEVDGSYEVGNKSKGYIVNQEFFKTLSELTSRKSQSITDCITNNFLNEFKKELAGKTPWEYTLAENGRKFNKMIIVPRPIKAELFKNYNNYDISSAAPTILFQLYHRLYKKLGVEKNRFNELKTIEYFIQNKNEVRQRIANDYELDINVVKKIINGLFNKAPFSTWDKTTIFKKYLKLDYDKMIELKRDDFIRRLRIDIRRMWLIVNSLMNEEVKKTTRRKNWFFYMKEESKIREIIEKELQEITSKKDMFYFLEHDGFRLHKKFTLNVEKVMTRIKEETQYEIQIEEEKTPLTN